MVSLPERLLLVPFTDRQELKLERTEWGPEVALVSAKGRKPEGVEDMSGSLGSLVWNYFSGYPFIQSDLGKEMTARCFFLSQTIVLGLELPFAGRSGSVLLVCT